MTPDDRLHELRTITSALVNGIELLVDHLEELPENIQVMVRQVSHDAQRLLKTVREL